MARDLSPDEAFDEKVAELTDQHARTRMAMLRAGDPVVINAVSQSVSAVITDKDMDMLVRLCVRDERAAGAHIAALVRKVVLGEAEVDAIRDAEQAERDAKEQSAEDRVEPLTDAQRPAFVNRASLDVQLAQERAERSPLVRMAMGRG